MPGAALPWASVVRQFAAVQRAEHRLDHGVVHHRHDGVERLAFRELLARLAAVDFLHLLPGHLAVAIPDGVAALLVLGVQFERAAFLSLARAFVQHLLDLLLEIGRVAHEVAKLLVAEKVLLVEVAAVLDVLAAACVRVDVPRVAPLVARDRLVQDQQRGFAGLVFLDGLLAAHLRDRPLDDAHPNPGHVENDLAHFGRVLAFHHPVVDALFGFLGLLVGQLLLFLRQVFDLQRNLGRLSRHARLLHDFLGLQFPGRRLAVVQHHIAGVVQELSHAFSDWRRGEREGLAVNG